MRHTISTLTPRQVFLSNLSYRIERGHTLLPNTDDIVKLNQVVGSHFFDSDTMRFFSSRVLSVCYPVRDGSTVFITSERRGLADNARGLTIRRAFADGRIDTVGGMGDYASRAATYRAAERVRDEIDQDPATRRGRAVSVQTYNHGHVVVTIVNARMVDGNPRVTTHRWTLNLDGNRPLQFPTDLWDPIRENHLLSA